MNDLNWFRGNSPGRIVEEIADPPVIAVRDEFHEDRWLATIWQPSRVLFCNPQNPCFHSDPSIPDCPPRDSVRVHGVVLFHQGSIESLIERVESQPRAGGSLERSRTLSRREGRAATA